MTEDDEIRDYKSDEGEVIFYHPEFVDGWLQTDLTLYLDEEDRFSWRWHS